VREAARINRPLVAFQIPLGEHAVYLGAMTLHIESRYNRDRGKQDYEVRVIEISDEFERAKQALAGSPGRIGHLSCRPGG
jgi:hypothetical protein